MVKETFKEKKNKPTWNEQNEQACRTLGCVEKVVCFAGKHAPLCLQAKELIQKEFCKEVSDHG